MTQITANVSKPDWVSKVRLQRQGTAYIVIVHLSVLMRRKLDFVATTSNLADETVLKLVHNEDGVQHACYESDGFSCSACELELDEKNILEICIAGLPDNHWHVSDFEPSDDLLTLVAYPMEEEGESLWCSPAILEDLGRRLEVADVNNDEDFARLVNDAMHLLNLSDAEVAREFSCARPTVGRWRNRMATPHPAMRKPIYNWLLGKTRAALQADYQPCGCGWDGNYFYGSAPNCCLLHKPSFGMLRATLQITNRLTPERTNWWWFRKWWREQNLVSRAIYQIKSLWWRVSNEIHSRTNLRRHS